MNRLMEDLQRAREDAGKLEAKLRGIADGLLGRGRPHPVYGAVRRAESLAGACCVSTETAITDAVLADAIGETELPHD